MEMDSFEKMYSVKEAGAMLGFSRDTVLRQIRRGRLKAWKLPGEGDRRKRHYECWRVPESSLAAFMRGNQNAA
jgi:excisionase family DNA binding protein